MPVLLYCGGRAPHIVHFNYNFGMALVEIGIIIPRGLDVFIFSFS